MTALINRTVMAAALALAALTGSASAQPAPSKSPPEYVSIVQDIAVNAPVDVAMKKTGGYCDIAAWFKTTCVYTVGSGGVGTNRLIAGRINEVMVAKTAYLLYLRPAAGAQLLSRHGGVSARAGGLEDHLFAVLRRLHAAGSGRQG